MIVKEEGVESNPLESGSLESVPGYARSTEEASMTLAFSESGDWSRSSSSLLSNSKSMPVILPATSGSISRTRGKRRSPSNCFCSDLRGAPLSDAADSGGVVGTRLGGEGRMREELKSGLEVPEGQQLLVQGRVRAP